LSNLFNLFSHNILPIFLAAAAGYLLSKYAGIDPRTISKIAFYIFSPSLIFTLLTTSQLNGDEISRMIAFSVASVLTLGAITWILGSLMRLERRLLVAVLLTVMFSNAGNYGLSLNLFAFGEQALAYASLYFVAVAAMIYTVGVFIASLGSASIFDSLLGMLKVPAMYAVGIAVAFNHFHWQLPLPLDRTVTILSDAAIPVLLVLLGIQLHHNSWQGQIKALTLANTMRLLAAPALAFVFCVVFGLQGAARQAGIAQSAMPTAVITTVLATEYNVEPSFVTSAVFASTLLSPLTITPILAFLGA